MDDFMDYETSPEPNPRRKKMSQHGSQEGSQEGSQDKYTMALDLCSSSSSACGSLLRTNTQVLEDLEPSSDYDIDPQEAETEVTLNMWYWILCHILCMKLFD